LLDSFNKLDMESMGEKEFMKDRAME